MHFLSLNLSGRDQLGRLRKAPSVLTAVSPLGKRWLLWPVIPATMLLWDHWESKGRQTKAERQQGYWGDHGGTELTEQINPGDYCQTLHSSGSHMVKVGSGLTWTSFNCIYGLQLEEVMSGVGGSSRKCRFKWRAFMHLRSDLLFHLMW